MRPGRGGARELTVLIAPPLVRRTDALEMAGGLPVLQQRVADHSLNGLASPDKQKG